MPEFLSSDISKPSITYRNNFSKEVNKVKLHKQSECNFKSSSDCVSNLNKGSIIAGGTLLAGGLFYALAAFATKGGNIKIKPANIANSSFNVPDLKSETISSEVIDKTGSISQELLERSYADTICGKLYKLFASKNGGLPKGEIIGDSFNDSELVVKCFEARSLRKKNGSAIINLCRARDIRENYVNMGHKISEFTYDCERQAYVAKVEKNAGIIISREDKAKLFEQHGLENPDNIDENMLEDLLKLASGRRLWQDYEKQIPLPENSRAIVLFNKIFNTPKNINDVLKNDINNLISELNPSKMDDSLCIIYYNPDSGTCGESQKYYDYVEDFYDFLRKRPTKYSQEEICHIDKVLDRMRTRAEDIIIASNDNWVQRSSSNRLMPPESVTSRVSACIAPSEEVVSQLDNLVRKYNIAYKMPSSPKGFEDRTDQLTVYIPKDLTDDIEEKSKFIDELKEVLSPHLKPQNLFDGEEICPGMNFSINPTPEDVESISYELSLFDPALGHQCLNHSCYEDCNLSSGKYAGFKRILDILNNGDYRGTI